MCSKPWFEPVEPGGCGTMRVMREWNERIEFWCKWWEENDHGKQAPPA